MADRDIKINLKANTRDFQKNMKGAVTQTEKMGSVFEKIVKTGALLFIGKKIIDIGKAAIKSAAQFEQFEIAFTTMLGSADRAKDLLNDIEDFAARTPFDLPQVVTGAKNLLAFGAAQDEVLPTLKALGDVSAGLAVPMERLILNYGQVRTQTKLTGMELRDFLRAGVPLIGELAKNLNVSEQEIKEMVSAGKVGFKDVEKAFMTMTGAGGRFNDLMIKQSETLAGRWSNLQDATTRLGKEFGNLLLPAVKSIVLALTEVVEWATAAIRTFNDWREQRDPLGMENTVSKIEETKAKLNELNENYEANRDKIVELRTELETLEYHRTLLLEEESAKRQALEDEAAAKDAKRMQDKKKQQTEYQKFEAQLLEARKKMLFANNEFELKTREQFLNDMANLQKSQNSTLAAIGKASAIYQIVLSTHAAAMNAYAALAGIPIVGPALGIAAAMAAIAYGGEQIAAVNSAAPGLAIGTPNVPDDMMANIHAGEMVVPDTFAEGIRGGDLTLGGPEGGGGSVVFSFDGANLIGAVPDDIIAQIEDKIFERQELGIGGIQ